MFFYSVTSAQYLDPTAKTNVNKIDPYLSQTIDVNDWNGTIEKNKSLGVTGIESGKNNFVDSVDVDKERSILENIDPQSMESEGIKAKNACPWCDDFFINTNAPGHQQRIIDAKDIASATGKLVKDLVSRLKNLGVDCKTVKGNKVIEPQYFIELHRENTQDRIYEPFFCEQPKNQYDTLDDLEIHCLQFSSRPEDMKITSTNFKYDVKNELMTMRHDYDPKEAKRSSNRKGLFQKNTDIYYDECQADLRMTFDVRLDPATFSEFALLNLYYTDLVLVKLNGKVV